MHAALCHNSGHSLLAPRTTYASTVQGRQSVRRRMSTNSSAVLEVLPVHFALKLLAAAVKRDKYKLTSMQRTAPGLVHCLRHPQAFASKFGKHTYKPHRVFYEQGLRHAAPASEQICLPTRQKAFPLCRSYVLKESGLSALSLAVVFVGFASQHSATWHLAPMALLCASANASQHPPQMWTSHASKPHDHVASSRSWCRGRLCGICRRCMSVLSHSA